MTAPMQCWTTPKKCTLSDNNCRQTIVDSIVLLARRIRIKRHLTCNSPSRSETNFLSWIFRWKPARPDPFGCDLEGPTCAWSLNTTATHF